MTDAEKAIEPVAIHSKWGWLLFRRVWDFQLNRWAEMCEDGDELMREHRLKQ